MERFRGRTWNGLTANFFNLKFGTYKFHPYLREEVFHMFWSNLFSMN